MNRNTKSYIQYFFKSNRRLFVLMCIGLFIIMPFITMNILGTDITNADDATIQVCVFITTLLSTFLVAGLMPMFTWRFLYKKTSCDMYFSLPITRKKLFFVQYFLGAVFGLVPLYINFLLQFILVGIFTNVMLMHDFIYFILLLIPFFMTYSIFTLVAVKCNNFIDALVASGAYLILPLILYVTIEVFFDANAMDLLIANDASNLLNEITSADMLIMILFFPISITELLCSFLLDKLMYFENNLPYIWISIGWIVCALSAVYVSMRGLIARKAEEAQQHTTSMLIYPLIITIFSIAMILGLFTIDLFSTSMFIMGAIVFVMYIIMRLFARRSLKVSVADIGGFMLLVATTLAIVLSFQATSGFALVREYPKNDEIHDINISYSNWSSEKAVLITIPKQNVEKFFDYFDEYLKKVEEKDTKNIQHFESEYQLNISYRLDDGNEVYRGYWSKDILDFSDLESLINLSSEVEVSDCTQTNEYDGSCEVVDLFDMYANNKEGIMMLYEDLKL